MKKRKKVSFENSIIRRDILELEMLHAVSLALIARKRRRHRSFHLLCLGAYPCRCVHVNTIIECQHKTFKSKAAYFPRFRTYRSMHVPGNLAPTRRAEKPFSSNCRTYHGSMLAERRRIRPPIFRAEFSVQAWAEASSPSGSNQSIESIIWKGLVDWCYFEKPDSYLPLRWLNSEV